MTEKNWAGNHTFTADRIHRPASLDELRGVVSNAERIRPLGSRHSFTDIADSAELIGFDHLADRFEISADRSTVTTAAHITYGRLAATLEPHGLALHNLASLPHITIAGAIATGTHGSGDHNGNLATAVVGLELMTSAGETRTVNKGHPDFDGLVVSLGSAGIVTAVTLAVQPVFEVQQTVVEDVPWPAVEQSFDAVFSSGYSVSAFSRFGPTVAQLWLKTVADRPRTTELFGGRAATEDRHPIIELPADSCTAQLGRPGLWSDRLPHFRMEFSPNVGDEIQSEFFVARSDTGAAIEALRSIGDRLKPALMVSEIRTIAGDELWMSPHHRRDSVAFHFTWFADPAAAQAATELVEAALAPFDPRPHWGKVFTPGSYSMPDLYPRLGDFLELIDRYDHRRAFRNRWLDRVIGAGT
ncbi:MAG: FAD-binding protein [Acidimicrobiales bacterium]